MVESLDVGWVGWVGRGRGRTGEEGRRREGVICEDSSTYLSSRGSARGTSGYRIGGM